MNSTMVQLEKVSDTKYERDCYPSRVVMWKYADNNYVTHIEVMPPPEEKRHYFFILGHYDMSLEDATYDFEKRCQALGVDSMFPGS